MSKQGKITALIFGLVVVGLITAGPASGQCMRGGDQTGVSTAAAGLPVNATSPNALNAAPQAMAAMAFRQHYAAQEQMLAFANRLAAQQAQQRAAYQQMVRPYRLARAEELRAQRAARAATRLREAGSSSARSGNYQFTSLRDN